MAKKISANSCNLWQAVSRRFRRFSRFFYSNLWQEKLVKISEIRGKENTIRSKRNDYSWQEKHNEVFKLYKTLT